jgi:hypothetical protein
MRNHAAIGRTVAIERARLINLQVNASKSYARERSGNA